eukprot:8524121-Prorocentrum_lima.AAC.1
MGPDMVEEGGEGVQTGHCTSQRLKTPPPNSSGVISSVDPVCSTRGVCASHPLAKAQPTPRGC